MLSCYHHRRDLKKFFGIILWDIPSRKSIVWSSIRTYLFIQALRLVSLYTLMLMINSLVMLLVIVKNLFRFSIILDKPHSKYTITYKELISIVEWLRQFRVILFIYDIKIFSYHNNLYYDATLSESQWVIHWRLIIKEFGPNIQHIAGFENIVAGTISKIPYTSVDKYEHITMKSQCCTNKLFIIVRDEKWGVFPRDLLNVQRWQQQKS